MTRWVRWVRKVRSRAHGPGRLHGLLDVEVRGVGPAEPEGVEHQDVHALERLQRRRREALAVGDVAQAAHPEAVHPHRAVGHHHGKEGAAHDLHRRRPRCRSWRRIRGFELPCGGLDVVVEDVPEVAGHAGPWYSVADPRRQVAPPAHREDAQVVDAVDVVRVDVREPDGVDAVASRRPGAGGGAPAACPPAAGPPPVSTTAPWRVRRSRGSGDVHAAQSHPTTGTPNDVPVPRKVSFTRSAGRRSSRLAVTEPLQAHGVGGARRCGRESPTSPLPTPPDRPSPSSRIASRPTPVSAS